MQENASTIACGGFSKGKWRSLDQWLSESCRIIGDARFQASQGKKFHQKLHISDDSKMCIHLCTAYLGLPRSAPQLWVVKHEKLEHVLDTIFWDLWAESVHRELISNLFFLKSVLLWPRYLTSECFIAKETIQIDSKSNINLFFFQFHPIMMWEIFIALENLKHSRLTNRYSSKEPYQRECLKTFFGWCWCLFPATFPRNYNFILRHLKLLNLLKKYKLL